MMETYVYTSQYYKNRNDRNAQTEEIHFKKYYGIIKV